MNFKDNLQIYNTDKKEYRDLLDFIYRKVSNNYIEGSTNLHKIRGITEAFNNFEYVLLKFELENEDILQDIKMYTMGCYKDPKTAGDVEFRMKSWGLFFEGIGVEPTFVDELIKRYRKDFIVEYINKEKKKVKYTIYLEYLMFVRRISTAVQAEQIKILEELKVKSKEFFNIFGDYIINSYDENTFVNRFLNISEGYLKELMEEEFLLKTIKDLIYRFLAQYKYDDFEQDIKRLYIIQNQFANWVDMNKLNKFISEDRLLLLEKINLIEEIYDEYSHLVRLTETGISLATNHLIDGWDGDKYFYESESQVLIPFNSNPMVLCKYLLNKNFVLKEQDFLLIFENIGSQLQAVN